jgi:hypothetical protein
MFIPFHYRKFFLVKMNVFRSFLLREMNFTGFLHSFSFIMKSGRKGRYEKEHFRNSGCGSSPFRLRYEDTLFLGLFFFCAGFSLGSELCGLFGSREAFDSGKGLGR